MWPGQVETESAVSEATLRPKHFSWWLFQATPSTQGPHLLQRWDLGRSAPSRNSATYEHTTQWRHLPAVPYRARRCWPAGSWPSPCVVAQGPWLCRPPDAAFASPATTTHLQQPTMTTTTHGQQQLTTTQLQQLTTICVSPATTIINNHCRVDHQQQQDIGNNQQQLMCHVSHLQQQCTDTNNH